MSQRSEKEINLSLWKRSREEEEEEDQNRKKSQKKDWNHWQKHNKVAINHRVSHNFIFDCLKFPYPPNALEREHMKNGYLGASEVSSDWVIYTRAGLWATYGDPIAVMFNPVVSEAYVRSPENNLVIRWQENFCEIHHPHFRLEVRLSHREHKNQHYLGINQLSFFNDSKRLFILDTKTVSPMQSFVLHHSTFPRGSRPSEIYASILHDLWSDYRNDGFPDHFQLEFCLTGILNTARNQVIIEYSPPTCKDCRKLSSLIDKNTLVCEVCQYLFYAPQ